MKLYSFQFSPNPLKVKWALKELKLDYQNEEVVLFKGEQRDEKFLMVNPKGKVPVLIDGEDVITESNAIIFHLGKRYGGNLWPTDHSGEIRALEWMFFESSQMTQHCGPLWFNVFGNPKMGREIKSDKDMAKQIEGAEWFLGKLERNFEKSEYLLGPDFSLADCALGTTLSILKLTSLGELRKWPRTKEYRDRILERPAFNQAGGHALFDL